MNQLNHVLDASDKYYSMLALMAGLSNLFSDSEIPFIHYRITENLFCRYTGATNLSRTDTAYDAKWEDIGIGVKTFILSGNSSKEKIAEFNALAPELKDLNGKALAHRLADFRNERMNSANGLYGINKALYHIIGRRKESLVVFNCDYDYVDKDNIRILKSTDKALHFTDEKNIYSFNRSKSVLMKDFYLPDDAKQIDVNIIEDPYTLLEKLLNKDENMEKSKYKERVILPLFSMKYGIKYVPECSGLNQWNAAGRARDEDEVYIPIPILVRRYKEGFFPDSKTPFILHLPDGSEMSAKVCQAGGKALMSNPNKALGNWLLRKVLHKAPGHLVTYQDLEIAGFDSIVITKNDDGSYNLDVSRDNSFSY